MVITKMLYSNSNSFYINEGKLLSFKKMRFGYFIINIIMVLIISVIIIKICGGATVY